MYICFYVSRQTTELNFMEFSFVSVWNPVAVCHGQL